jgi:hypothetical protein
MVFNPKQRDFLATGNGSGIVHIWKLGWRLSNVQSTEHTDLDAFMKAAMADEDGD